MVVDCKNAYTLSKNECSTCPGHVWKPNTGRCVNTKEEPQDGQTCDNITSDSNEKCSVETAAKPAKSTCEELNKMKMRLDAQIEHHKLNNERAKEEESGGWAGRFINNLNPLNVVNTLAENLTGGEAEVKTLQTTLNMISTTMNDKQITENESKCIQNLKNITEQTITGTPPECLEIYVKHGLPPPATRMTNITQESDSKIKAKCQLDTFNNVISNMDATAASTAIQDAVNKAVGGGSSAASDQFACNEVTTDINSCKFIKNAQCCSNQLRNISRQRIDMGCTNDMDNINQLASSEIKAACGMVQDSKNESGQTSTSTAEIENSSDNSADNSWALFGGMFLGVIVLIFIIGWATSD